MTKVSRDSFWDQHGKIIVIYLLIVLILVIILFILVLFFYIKPGVHPIESYADLNLTAEYNNNTNSYSVYIKVCHDPEEELSELKDVFIVVTNGTSSCKYIVHDILNIYSNNITYYDHDGNGKISIGDEFKIDYDIVGP